MVDENRLTSGMMISTYRLTEQIGKGGFSTVWSAWDIRLMRLIAIKLLDLRDEEEASAARFEREASVIAQLQHPFIVPLYDFGKTLDQRFLVMRYVGGGSLAHRLQQTPQMPIAETLRLITLIASALDYVHEQEIVHRDLKPANILLDAQGLPYLSDFGLAKSIHQYATQHTVAGTAFYMSPEQYLGERLTTQTDIFSFGIMIYQLLAGALPHGGTASHGGLQLRHGVEERLPDITLVQPSLPPALNDVFWEMTAFHPHDRPSSAQGVVRRVATLLAARDETLIEQEALTLLQTVNTGSMNYRRLEAERILQRTLPAWQRGELPLNLTEFVLLHDYLQETPTLVSQPVGALMLRSAFEYGQFIETWWNTSDQYRQWLACDHAIANGGAAAARALGELKRLIAGQTEYAPALADLRENLTQHVAEQLMPPSALTAPALDALQLLLERPTAWPTQRNDAQAVIDHGLAKVAMSASTDAQQATTLIGLTRRSEAVSLLAKQPHAFEQLMMVREAAGSLPREAAGLSTGKRWQVVMRLAVRQLLRRPLNSFLQYMLAAVGCVLGMGWLVYSVYPDTPAKMLNVIGLGLLFGTLFALGLWVARHIAATLRVLAVGWRFGVAALAGGVIMAGTFTLINQSLYDESLDVWLALASGIVFVAGIVISVRWSHWAQVLAGMVGMMLALLVPWAGYLRYYDGLESFAFPAVPFVFRATSVIEAFPTVLIATLVMAGGLALGAKLLPDQTAIEIKMQENEVEEKPLTPVVGGGETTREFSKIEARGHGETNDDSDKPEVLVTKELPPR
jgi:serine/threonine protein kinase